MRVMVIVKASKNSEAGGMPRHPDAQGDGRVQRRARKGRDHARRRRTQAKLEAASAFTSAARSEAWSTARSLRPRSSSPASGSGRFVRSKRPIEWVKRCPNPMPGEESDIEIRPVFEAEDFGEALTPELREQEERQRAEMAARSH